MLQYIIWNVDPEIFRIGTWPVRWYGLLFAAGFLIGVQSMTYIFKTEKKPLSDTDSLLITMVVSTILGARLGHFLFYEPYMFIQNPLRIITPPFEGLASHGAIGSIIIGLWLYSRRQSSQASGQTFWWVSDRICITVALAGAFIRFGNLMNSEILGKPTTVPWAFVFLRDHEFSHVPRHPTQLYESISYLTLFFILFWYWRAYRKQSAPGTMVGIFLIWIFGFRFVWEFFKENQVAFEDTMRLNMGQLLSMPAILFGLILLLRNFIRPASLIPIALVIQSSNLCYQCDYKSASPVPEQAHSDRCEELISDKQPLKIRHFQDRVSKVKRTYLPFSSMNYVENQLIEHKLADKYHHLLLKATRTSVQLISFSTSYTWSEHFRENNSISQTKWG